MENKRAKYPIGIQDFQSIIQDGYIYVDKTAILYDLIDSGKTYFLSRPRRFGKSLTLSTLEYFFEGRKDLFEGLAISKLEKEWKKHPVFHISFARFEKDTKTSMEDILEFYLKEWEEKYKIEDKSKTFANRFAAIINKAVRDTGEKAVILIDEYDSALVSTLENKDLHEHNKSLLKPFYTVIKDLDRNIKFTLITGITRFSKMTIFSGLNNLNDISLDKDYSAICGITPHELEKYFQSGIERLGKRYGYDYEKTVKELKTYYDGYHFSGESEDIYNPFSILNAFFKAELNNYWFQTGIPSFIVRRMRSENIDLEKYMNQEAPPEVLTTSDSAYISDLALLFQAGFLTIKAYDLHGKFYTLGIPNLEVKEGMSKLFMREYLYPDENTGNNLIYQLTKAIKAGEPEVFLTLLKSFFAGVPFDMSKGDKEVYFHNSFYIVTNLIGLQVSTEKHVSTGSIDLVISTPEFVYVIEIKLNRKAQEAIDQINSRQYPLAWSADKRKIFKIGAVFSSRTRTLRDWIIE